MLVEHFFFWVKNVVKEYFLQTKVLDIFMNNAPFLSSLLWGNDYS